jgi:hypothetical protein
MADDAKPLLSQSGQVQQATKEHTKTVKLSLCLTIQAKGHEDVWESGGIVPPIFTLVLDEGDCSAPRTSLFTSWETAVGMH